jgi:hypothetical protein
MTRKSTPIDIAGYSAACFGEDVNSVEEDALNKKC